MPRRVVIVLLQPVRWHPPGIDPDRWRAALAEDTVDLLHTLAEADAGIAAVAGERDLAEAVAWPTMPVYEVTAPDPAEVFAAAARDGYDQAAVLAPDAPDLPGLLVGKLLRPLTTRPLAVAPALGTPLPAIVDPVPGAAGSRDAAPANRMSGAGSPAARPAGPLPGADRPLAADEGVRSDAADHPSRTPAVVDVPGSPLSDPEPPAELGRGLLGVACRLPAPAWLPRLDLDMGTIAAIRAAAPNPGDVVSTPAWRRLRGPVDLSTLDPRVEGWEATRALLSA